MDPTPTLPQGVRGSIDDFSVHIWIFHEIHSKNIFAFSPHPMVMDIGDITFHADLAISFNSQQDFKIDPTPHPRGRAHT